jgi:hypothetical protein
MTRTPANICKIGGHPMVKVSSALYRELTKIILGPGEVDMQDPDAVLKYAQKHGFNIAARTIQGNSRRYLQCINEGMEASD